MPLRNRVFPDQSLRAISERGLWLGNRGGRFHRDDQTLKSREFASKQWIYCTLTFKNRHRNVMTKGYTELFFADEVSALASGHRPCFECQRHRAKEFAKVWNEASPPKAPEMDAILHVERAQKWPLPPHLPINTMIEAEGKFYVKTLNGFDFWEFGKRAEAHPSLEKALLLTPPSIIRILERGFNVT